MKNRIIFTFIFVSSFLLQSSEIKDVRELNKIHSSPFSDSYIVTFNGSSKGFSLDKIKIDKPKEKILKKIRFLTDEDIYAIKVFGKENKFLYTLGIGNPFYASYQHIGYEDRDFMGGPVTSAKIEIAIPLHVEPTSFIISKRDIGGKFKDIQEISIE
tara:strand:- start:98 stop:568 length:471 start_codon:yes stop_codon:yes gene_type:complete